MRISQDSIDVMMLLKFTIIINRIVRAGFLAPTEWSMRADGLALVWAKHFLADRGEDPRLRERVETLFAAFDPCTDLVWEDRHA